LFVLGALFCAAAIPPTDVPETAYNEVDTPINQSPPVVPSIRLIRPSPNPVVVPAEFRDHSRDASHRLSEHPPAPLVSRQGSHSIQDVLCILII